MKCMGKKERERERKRANYSTWKVAPLPSVVKTFSFEALCRYSSSSENTLCADNSYCSRPGGQSQEEEEDSQIPFGPRAPICNFAKRALPYKDLITIPPRTPLLPCIEKKKNAKRINCRSEEIPRRSTISSRWRDKIFMHGVITGLSHREKHTRNSRFLTIRYYFFHVENERRGSALY